jgi:predicted NBD/HSP70 family sugar kinase
MLNGAAAPPLLRRLNATRVLTELRASGPLRVTELVELTGFSRPTIESIADDLVGLGWASESVIEAGQRRGRPARELTFRADGGVVLGVDVGVGRVTLIAADLAGEVRAERSEALDSALGAPDRLARVVELARDTIGVAGFPPYSLMRAVVGSPGIVDAESGIVMQSPTLPGWNGLHLGEELSAALGCAVQVENDANLAAEGERWRGVGEGIRDLVFVLAGERLGAGIVVDGRTVRGYAGGAGEMGFTQLFATGQGSEGIGALGREAGRDALRRLLADSDAADSGQLLRSLAGDDPGQVNVELLLEAARLGDTVARDVLEDILAGVARAIAVLAILLNPQLIVVGGAVADAAGQILPPLREGVSQLTLLPTRIEASVLSHRAVALGAVHAAVEATLEELVEREAPIRA